MMYRSLFINLKVISWDPIILSSTSIMILLWAFWLTIRNCQGSKIFFTHYYISLTLSCFILLGKQIWLCIVAFCCFKNFSKIAGGDYIHIFCQHHRTLAMVWKWIWHLLVTKVSRSNYSHVWGKLLPLMEPIYT